MFPPPPNGQMDDPFGVPLGAPSPNDNAAAAAWRERRERQRNLRFLMMFVMMLLLMEGEEPNMNDPHHVNKMRQSLKQQFLDRLFLDDKVFKQRKALDKQISKAVRTHPKHKELSMLNADLDSKLRMSIESDEALQKNNEDKKKETNGEDGSQIMIHHYPRNATGFYRGDWNRQEFTNAVDDKISQKIENVINSNDTSDLEELTELQIDLLKNRGKGIGVYLLEPGLAFDNEKENNSSKTLQPKVILEKLTLEAADTIEEVIMANYAKKSKEDLSLLHFPSDGGKTALQLYSKLIPGMNEISFVDGFIKLYDGPGYTSHNDMLLRVRGVAVHNIGRLSLLANAANYRSVLYVESESDREYDQINNLDKIDLETQSDMTDLEQTDGDEERRRRLTHTLRQLDHLSTIEPPPDDYKAREEEFLQKLRDEAVKMNFLQNSLSDGWTKMFESPGYNSVVERDDLDMLQKDDISSDNTAHRRLLKKKKDTKLSTETKKELNDLSGLHVYPYVPDDEVGTEKKSLGIYRHIPTREQAFEFNTLECEFEINLYTPSIQWEVSELEKLLIERRERIKAVSSSKKQKVRIDKNDIKLTNAISPSMRKEAISKPKEAFITELSGEIISPVCQFAANVTVTAIRIDWEATKRKAINYSFYMMLTCLAQIVLLLRQLLHTQAQSAAIRVSLLCIGWQTLLDAIFCIAHILLCLIMSPFLPAFSSVAFFKLLIFGVIEMKYMAIIVRARINAADPNSTSETVRRRVTLLQVQFYGALFFALMFYWYIGRYYLSFYVMILYSFWVPQILQNIITEAKRPLHKHYIYGMSLTRLMAPLYMFAVPNNFWKTANPEFESNLVMCELVVVWVGIQTAILIAQSKFGARFMIPAR